MPVRLPVLNSAPPRPASLLEVDDAGLWLRKAKVAALAARRLLRWATDPAAWPTPLVESDPRRCPHLIYERDLPIARSDDAAEPVFEEGKRHNLALAAPAFDGLLVAPDRPLSFWRALGRVTAARGFRAGMELSGGCIVPALGGGLCLLSNALFALAVQLGWTVLERHGHTLSAVPPGPGELFGLDATVFWPYVDLRVAPRAGRAWLRVEVRDGRLRIAVYSDGERPPRVELSAEDERVTDGPAGRFRENRLRRRAYDADGALLFDDIVAENRKRLLDPAQTRRSCLSCGETTCRARPGHLALVRGPVRPG